MKARKGHRAVGQHSSKSEDWGTDAHVVALLHRVQGLPDVDPASSPKWNQIIRAKRIITKREDGRRVPWVEGAPSPRELDRMHERRALEKRRSDTAHVNAPGEKSGENVALFWRATAGYYELGYLASAAWIGFSVEQLSRLQRVGAASHPLLHVTCIPEVRRKYSKRPGVAGEQPGHASFITLLPSSRAQARLFAQLFAELGHVIVGDRWR